jgi:DNA-binding winged helix-turn-helix (wHTH) protein
LSTSSTNVVLSFGPFRLMPSQGLLLRAGQPVPIGSRALNILVALVELAGEVVSKEALFAIGWPDTIVEESSLRVNVAAARKALGDGQNGARYIATVPGRGYRFIAPVSVSPSEDAGQASVAAPRGFARGPSRIFGRDDLVDSLSALLQNQRLVTVVGPGG